MSDTSDWLDAQLWSRLSRPTSTSHVTLPRVARALARRMIGMLRFAQLTLQNYWAKRSVIDPTCCVVVSLTTHRERLTTAYAAIESIGRGQVRPRRLILWLDEDLLADGLPASLERLRRRGLEIRATSDHGPHTKYWPFVTTTTPGTGPLAIADDDIMYPNYWLRLLVDSYRRHPEDVHCYRSRVMRFVETRPAPWSQWGWCDSPQPSVLNLPTGVSGVLYPSSVLDTLRSSGSEFQLRASTNDDIWLHRAALRSGARIRQLGSVPIHFATIPGSQRLTLMSLNVGDNRNDDQVAMSYTQQDLKLLMSENS